MHEAPHSPARSVAVLAALVAVPAAAWAVFRGALPYYFSQDDFWWLAHARGLLPAWTGPWRLVSFGLWFRLLNALAGLDATLWHAASVALLAIAGLLLFLVVRSRVGAPAAIVASV